MLLSVVYLYASIYVSQYSNIHSGNLIDQSEARVLEHCLARRNCQNAYLYCYLV